MSQLVTSTTAAVNQMIDDISEMDGKYLGFWTDKQLFGKPEGKIVLLVDAAKILSDNMVENFMYHGGMGNV